MKRRIVKIGNPVLTRQSEHVVKFDGRLRRLVRDLFETMYSANGLGLAAPQVGISLKVAVVDVVPKGEKVGRPLVLINPEIIEYSGTQVADEGCLSIPNVKIEMLRPYSLTIQHQTEDGSPPKTLTVEELTARAICHEIDHLNGILITDYVMLEGIQ